jgi:hypothetical protein
MRLTIATPIAAMAAVSGRWPSIHCRLAAGSGLGLAPSGEGEVGPPGAEADHHDDQPDGQRKRADRPHELAGQARRAGGISETTPGEAADVRCARTPSNAGTHPCRQPTAEPKSKLIPIWANQMFTEK